jgi:hypothetical protein
MRHRALVGSGGSRGEAGEGVRELVERWLRSAQPTASTARASGRRGRR